MDPLNPEKFPLNSITQLRILIKMVKYRGLMEVG